MKKLVIWEEKYKTEENNDNHTYLKLKHYEDLEVIALIACDKNGEIIRSGNILSIMNDYKIIVINTGLNDSVPLKTDFKNAALVVSQYEMDEFIHDIRRNEILDRLSTQFEKPNDEHVKH